jgi:hypothetical protein
LRKSPRKTSRKNLRKSPRKKSHHATLKKSSKKYVKNKRKYRAWSEKDKKKIKTIKRITIPKGTILYRTQDIRCDKDEGRLKAVYDKDTGRMGQYFSDGPIIPYGMIMEYDKPMHLCIFIVVENINNVLVGKKSYQKDNPEYYYDTYMDYLKGKFKEGIKLKMTSSIDSGLLPLHDYFQEDESGIVDLIKEHEIFLSSGDTNNWKKLKHLYTTELITQEEAQNNIDKLLEIQKI